MHFALDMTSRFREASGYTPAGTPDTGRGRPGSWRRGLGPGAGSAAEGFYSSYAPVETLRALRRIDHAAQPLRVSDADPLNLAGILLPGRRVSALAGVQVDVLPVSAAS
jgi:hypothetical protein